MFEHILRLWIGVWLHIHIVTTADVPPDLWKLAQILPFATVQMMPLCFGWGCRTFQTVSHAHGIHMIGVWAPSQVLDGYMASHSHHYHHRCCPRFGKVGWNPTRCKCANHATMLWLSLYNLSSCIPSHVHAIHMRCLSIFSGYWCAYGSRLTSITIDTSLDLWDLTEILPFASVQTMPLHFGWGCRTFQTASHVHG